MKATPFPSGDDSSELDEVLADYFVRLDRGDQIDQESLCQQFPHLADHLREYFSQERNIVHAEAETAVFDGTRRASSGALKIRCPHCQSPQSVAVDAPLVDLLCPSCGSNYSLAGDADTASATMVSQIGHFELLDRLGVGGFGSVWKARDTELDRVVAVKVPRRGDMSAEEIDKFFREARAAAQLSHPNIVAVHEVGRDGRSIYIVSDLVRGVSLADWLTGHKPTAREAAQLVGKIADALQHAHEHGVVHRDLKPGNILIDQQGEPHLVDFGLARREAGEVTMTVEGQILGTPAYMSPEQARGESHSADRRSDIYSLGAVLFQLLTGELPFRGNVRMLIHQIVNDEPPSPRKLNASIPKDLETITLKCLEKDIGKRFQNAHEVLGELRRYLYGEPIQSRPLSRLGRAIRWGRRHPLRATVAGLILFLAIAGPLVALRLAQLQWSLRERLAERATYISQKTQEEKRSAARIKRLEEQLAHWEGKANPWDFWPPKKEDPLRRDIAIGLLAHLRSMAEVNSMSSNYTPREKTLYHLAVARLSDLLGQTNEARAGYEAACRLLEVEKVSSRESTVRHQTLAECHVRLSQLLQDKDRTAAERHAEAARSIQEELANKSDDALASIAWLESEWASSRFERFDVGSERFIRFSQAKKRLPELWPNSASEAYRLAYYLAGAEPILLHEKAPTVPIDNSSE